MKLTIAPSLSILALLLAAGTTAALPPEAEQDEARWRDITLFAQRFDPPPENWLRIDDQRGKLSFSMPCEAHQREMTTGDVEVKVYSCHVGERVYQVMVGIAPHVNEPEWLDGYWLGQERGMVRRFEELGATVTVRPRLRVAYEGGLSGRQSTLDLGTRQMEVRCLAGKHLIITLMLMDSKEKAQGNLYDFFNSLRLD